MTNNQQIRQADNRINITGVLNEKNLEVREFTNHQTNEKYNAITGTLDVRTGEHEVHKVRFFAKEFTNAGAENQQYKGLLTVQNEYLSIADLAKSNDPEAKPSEINIVGDLNLNEFYGRDGQLQQRMQLSGRFANRLREQDDNTPKAEFDVEGVVKNVVEEFDRDGEPTERAKIELLVPMFGGRIQPLSFVVGENGKDYVMDNFDNGASVRIYGDVTNFRKVTKREVEMGFGANKIEEDVTFINEYLVQGGTVYEEGVHDSRIFDLKLLEKAGVERAKHLEDLKTRAEQKKTGGGQPKTGFGSGQATPKPSGKSAAERMGVDMKNLF